MLFRQRASRAYFCLPAITAVDSELRSTLETSLKFGNFSFAKLVLKCVIVISPSGYD